MGLAVSNQTIRMKLSDFLGGKMTKISEIELMDLIYESQIDTELIRILSGKDPDTIEAFEGIEYITAFFAYFASNKPRFSALLASIGYQVQQTAPSTRSKVSK